MQEWIFLFIIKSSRVQTRGIQCQGLPPTSSPSSPNGATSRSATISDLVAQTFHIPQGDDGCINSSSGPAILLCSASSVHLQHRLKYTLYVCPPGSAENQRREPFTLAGITASIYLYKIYGLCKETSIVLGVSTLPENKQLPERSEVYVGN